MKAQAFKNRFMFKQGFTLIELMIAIAIIGILAAIAVPTYNTYVYKSRVSELVSRASALESAVGEYISAQGIGSFTNPAFPTANFGNLMYGACPSSGATIPAGQNTASGNIQNLCLEAGAIILVQGTTATSPQANGNVGASLMLSPTLNPDGTIVWNCNACDATTANYAPVNCQTIGNCPTP